MTNSTIAASSSTLDAITNFAKQVFELVERNVDATSKVVSNDRPSISQSVSKSTRSRKTA